MKLLVNDIYPAIQGEGSKAGIPMVIVRLQGCAVGCSWCDTKESWSTASSRLVGTIDEARETPAAFCEMTEEEILDSVKRASPNWKWVLLTGGEPAAQNIVRLIRVLKANYKVCLETSGLYTGHLVAGEHRSEADWVVVSPKEGAVRRALDSADEIKMVVDSSEKISRLFDLASGRNVIASVQPVFGSEESLELCHKAIAAYGWRLSLQTHKFIGLR